MTRIHDGEFYTVSQAATLLTVSPSTIWRWIESGKLRAYRLGLRKIRIKKEDLDILIKPARGKEVPMDEERAILQPISQEELARRQSLVAQILSKSKERSIAPLTTADLVRKARAKERQSYAS